MSAGIIRGEDRGLVGFVPEFGHTWHKFPEYVEMDDAVPLPEVRKCLDYTVVKVPLVFSVPQEVPAGTPEAPDLKIVNPLLQFPNVKDSVSTGMNALVRTDTGRILHDVSVGSAFEIYQNVEFVDRLNRGLFANYPAMAVESCGTLWGGRIAFINILLNRYRTDGDESETIDRLMFYNTFGGRSDSACIHSTRIVCNNTLMMAEAQGALNKTLRKFRHTSGIVERVEDYLVDLTELQKVIDAHHSAILSLSTRQMNVKDVVNFLGNMFPIKVAPGKKLTKGLETGRENKRAAVQNIFETAPDLQGKIARTRYAMLNAVTNWNQHTIPEESETVDEAFTWYDVATGGVRNDRNQQALQILLQPTIPDVPVLVGMN